MIAVLVLAGCTGGEMPPVQSDPKPVTKKAPTPEQAKQKKLPVVQVKDEPLLTQKTGRIDAIEASPVAVKVDASRTTKVATFVQIEAPSDLTVIQVNAQSADTLLFVKAKGHHGFAVPMGRGRVADRPLMLVRFPGEAPPEFQVEWYQRSVRGQPGIRQVFTVTQGAEINDDEGLPDLFAQAASQWFEARGELTFGRRSPFHTFAAARMASKSSTGARLRRSPRTELGQMMAFYTGLTSVEEALQHDRGLRVRAQSDANTPLEKVTPVVLSNHPWAKMLAALPPDKQPKIEPLASLVPDDMLYLHFHDLRTLVRLAKDVSEIITPVGRVLETRSGASYMTERYERQLAVERLGLAETLGHLAVDGVALVAGDPYFREGTDVSILFGLKNETVLTGALSTYEARAKTRRPDAVVSEITIGTHSVRRFGTSDKAINQYRVKLGKVLVLSNSQAGITRIIATHDGKVPALSKSGEFRYFRHLYPFDTKSEDGFAFIGDALVGRVIGPRQKILQTRRMAARADLFAVNYAALLYGWLNGKVASNTDELKADGILSDSDLLHADGSKITYSPETGARSERWGNVWGMSPLAGLELTMVTHGEASAYRRFAETYQSYWRGFIDPIGVRIRRSPDGKTLDVDAIMMPLINRSDYRETERLVGEQRIAPKPLDGGIQWTVAVAADSPLRRDLEGLGQSMSSNRDIRLDWLGDWVMAGTADRASLWDLAVMMGEIPTLTVGKAVKDHAERKRIFGRIPFYVGAHIRNKIALAATLTAIKTVVEKVAPGAIKWGEKNVTYRDVGVVTVEERIDGDGGITVYYAMPKDVLILSPNREVLERLIDRVLDNGIVSSDGATAQSTLAVRPQRKWLPKVITGLSEYNNRHALKRARRVQQTLAIAGINGDSTAQRHRALAHLGYEPLAPDGKPFKGGVKAPVDHPTYGSELSPIQPAVPIEHAPLSRFIKQLDRLRLDLSMDGKELTRSLHTHLIWVRK